MKGFKKRKSPCDNGDDWNGIGTGAIVVSIVGVGVRDTGVGSTTGKGSTVELKSGTITGTTVVGTPVVSTGAGFEISVVSIAGVIGLAYEDGTTEFGSIIGVTTV